MNIIPEIGLVVWTAFIFLTLFVLLRVFAWKPILGALTDRQESIENSLKAAESAREEMASLKSDNEKLLLDAKAERSALLKEAQTSVEAFRAEEMKKAGEEADKFLVKAKASFESDKKAAIASLRKEAASLTVELAEKVLRKELENKGAQEQLISDYLKDATVTA